jgi:hypothetical protein
LPTNETLLKNIKGRKTNEEVPIEVEYTAEFKRKRSAFKKKITTLTCICKIDTNI